jgi:hypothetical protein
MLAGLALGPQVEKLKPPVTRGYAPHVLSSVFDRLHRIRVARPPGDPAGIAAVERYRVAQITNQPAGSSASPASAAVDEST